MTLDDYRFRNLSITTKNLLFAVIVPLIAIGAMGAVSNNALDKATFGHVESRLISQADDWGILVENEVDTWENQNLTESELTQKKENLKDLIAEQEIGKTGYIYVLGGTGDNKGHYIVSKNRERDGEDLLSAQDADGDYFIQEIVNRSVDNPDEVFLKEYPWKNPGEENARPKVAAIRYVEELDWVIGVSAYYSDFTGPSAEAKSEALSALFIGGVAIMALAVGLSLLYGRSISKPLKKLEKVSEEASEGKFDALEKGEIELDRNDEIGSLSSSFQRAIASLKYLQNEEE